MPRVLNNVDKTPKIDDAPIFCHESSHTHRFFCWGFVYRVIWLWETATHDSCTLVLSAFWIKSVVPFSCAKARCCQFLFSAWAKELSAGCRALQLGPWLPPGPQKAHSNLHEERGWGFWTRGWTLRWGSESSKLREKVASQTKQKAPYCVHTIWLMGSFDVRIGRRRWLLKPKFHAPCRPCFLSCWNNWNEAYHMYKTRTYWGLAWTAPPNQDVAPPGLICLQYFDLVLHLFWAKLLWPGWPISSFMHDNVCPTSNLFLTLLGDFKGSHCHYKDSILAFLRGGWTRIVWGCWRNIPVELMQESSAKGSWSWRGTAC